MNMSELSQHTQEVLKKNGWYEGREYDRLEEFETASGDKLFPIGAYQDYIVYAGQTKRIYLGCWACLYMMGNSIEEYLENAFKKRYEPVEIMLDR